jgi:hypothetical protein
MLFYVIHYMIEYWILPLLISTKFLVYRWTTPIFETQTLFIRALDVPFSSPEKKRTDDHTLSLGAIHCSYF